jgi:hypothetical protein
MYMVQAIPEVSSTGKLIHLYRSLTSPKSAKARAAAACEFSFSFVVARRTPHRAIFGALFTTL